MAEETPRVQAKRPSVSELLTFFESVVFGAEFSGVKTVNRVRKWRGPLRYQIREFHEKVVLKPGGFQDRQLISRRVKKLHREFVLKHLTSLSHLTGLKVEDADQVGRPANINFSFVPRLQMANARLARADQRMLQRLASHGGCYFVGWTGRGAASTFVEASIVVNIERLMRAKDHCVLEEATQSLGFPNDVSRPWPTIFSGAGGMRGGIRELSRPDRIIVKTLYDRRMLIGLAKTKALKLAGEIIAELDRKLP